jgi:hypothetical protein
VSFATLRTGEPIAPTFATYDASDVHDVLLPSAHAPAVHSIVCRSGSRDHHGCVSREGGEMQCPPKMGAASLKSRDVVEVNSCGELWDPRRCEGIDVYLVPRPDEVSSQLYLLPRQAPSEVEVGVDECDSHGQVWARSSLRLLRLGCHNIIQIDGKWESMESHDRGARASERWRRRTLCVFVAAVIFGGSSR